MEKVILRYFLCSISVSIINTLELTYTINEEPNIGLEIGNVANESGLYQILNDSERNSMKYTILESTYASYFNVSERTSHLYVKKRLDRESLAECEFSLSCQLSIDIVAQSTVGTFFRKIKVRITIIDINDHRPKFQETSMTLELPEAFVVGSSSPITGAVDGDSGDNSVQKYYLEPQGTPFTLTFEKYVDGSSSVRIVVSSKLDRETVDFYKLKIIAEDGGNPKLTGTLDLNVTITDVNDNSPTFNQSTYSVSIKEDEPVGKVIYQIKAEDPDLNENGMVTYRLSPHQSESIKQIFNVTGKTGELFTLKPLVYTQGEPYKVIIEANDGATIPLMSQATIFVTVLDSNNNAPTINVNLLSNSDLAKISENASIGAAVAHIAVSDDDMDQNGNVTCLITHDVFKLDSIGTNEYKVVVSKPLNRESEDEYKVVIVCKDAGNPPKNSTAEFNVKVLDENDNRPTFLKSHYEVTLPENNFVGAFIVKVSAIDLDIGVNAEVNYFMEPTPHGFIVDRFSGVVSANFVLDYDKLSTMEFRVLARDNGSTPETGTAVITVNLTDINDNAPTFTKSVYVMYAKENEPQGFYVGEVIANDIDSISNGKVTFAADSEFTAEIPFEVLPDGSIFTKRSLDREAKPHGYNFNVIATDHGSPALNATAHITIFVQDENDNAPIISFPTPENGTVQIVYEKPSDSVITQVMASDSDTGDNALLSYSIVQTDMKSTFRIDSQTGKISLARSLSTIDMKSYTLTIEVKDGGIPERKDRQNLTVIISSNSVLLSPRTEPEKDNALIVIVIVCVTIILSGAIIMVIFLIRRMDRKKKEKKRKNNGVVKNEDKDMYDSIHRNGSVPPIDLDHMEKKVNFTPSYEGNGHILQLSNGHLSDREDVTQIADGMMQPPKRDVGGRSVHSGKFKIRADKVSQTTQMQRLNQQHNNIQKWHNQNGLIILRKNDDNHSETSGETNDSGRGGSESDIHSSGFNQSVELDCMKNRYSPTTSPGHPLLTKENMKKFQYPKDRHKSQHHPSYLVQNNNKHSATPNGLLYLNKHNSVHWNSIHDVLNGSMATIDDYDDDTTTSGSYVVDDQELDFECSLPQDCVV